MSRAQAATTTATHAQDRRAELLDHLARQRVAANHHVGHTERDLEHHAPSVGRNLDGARKDADNVQHLGRAVSGGASALHARTVVQILTWRSMSSLGDSDDGVWLPRATVGVVAAGWRGWKTCEK